MKMRIVIALAVLAATVSVAEAQYGSPNVMGGGYGIGSNPSSHYVQGYTTSRGTYVAPHFQTNPNSTTLDNYSTRGNYNPHTGAFGTRSPRY